MNLIGKIEKNKNVQMLGRKIRNAQLERSKKKNVKAKYQFINRSNNENIVCIILAGYKEFLWDDVFGRIKKFCPHNIDVCIVSSGLYNDTLNEIAQKNNWSYLSLKQNKVTLAQNVAIHLFPNAKKIIKLDEDMFITKNFFKSLLKTYDEVLKKGDYKIGFVAPMIPINGYSYLSILEKVGLREDFEKKFGRCYHNGNGEEAIINNPEIAKYFWGSSQKIFADIDKLDEKFGKEKFQYSICPIRFSIGAILFSREIWEQMGRFHVGLGTDMGLDEEQFCKFCTIKSNVMVISENTVVGHFSYGPQTKEMKEYYEKNKTIFSLSEEKKK